MAFLLAFVAFRGNCGTTFPIAVMFLVTTTPLALLGPISARALGLTLGLLPFSVLAGLVIRSLLYVDGVHAHAPCHV